MWWYIGAAAAVVAGAVAAIRARRHWLTYAAGTMPSGHPGVADAVLVTGAKPYLRLDYAYAGKTYVTYVPYYPRMAAQGWRVTDPTGAPLPFHPGALPCIEAAALGFSHFEIRQGAKPVRRETVLLPLTLASTGPPAGLV
jgi:hypothetical protein